MESLLSKISLPFEQYPVMLAILIGAGLAAYLLQYSHSNKKISFTYFWGRALIVAAAVYIGFALFNGKVHNVLIEVVGLGLFTSIAYAGMRKKPSLLVWGWMLHLSWDLLLHPVMGNISSHAPWWYPSICIGFDIFAAGFLFVLTISNPQTEEIT